MGRRTTVWALAFAVAGLAGRATALDDLPIAFVWPAAGVAVLWFVAAVEARRAHVDLAVLAGVSVAVNLVTGASVRFAVVLAVANVVNAVAGGATFRRLDRSPRHELRDTPGLVALAGGALAGAVASAPVSVVFLVLEGSSEVASLAVVWVSRYSASSAVVMALVLAWRTWWSDRWRGGAPAWAPRPLEVVVLLAVGLAVNQAVFSQRADHAFAFLTLPVTVAVGWRLGAAWTATYGVLVGALGVVATIAGRGPFGGLEPVTFRTAVVQGFIAVSGLVGLALSLEVRQRHAALLASHRRGDALERTLEAAVVGNALLSLAPGSVGRIRYANPALRRWWRGEGDRPLVGRSWLDVLDLTDRPAFRRVLDQLAFGGRQVWNGELRHRLPDGEQRCCQAAAARLLLPAGDGDGDVPVVNLQLVDITERKLLEAQLVRQALHDQLTALPNRALLEERVEHALATASRSGRSVALVFLDLDHFKKVNDSLGHAAGDAVLTTVAERLVDAVRPGDTVARVGGDEFVVCCPEIDVAEHAAEVAARMVRAVRRPVAVAGRELEVGVSAGVTIARPGAAADDLLRESDSAMYEAKSGGRGRVEFYREPLLERARLDLDLEGELRRGLAAHEFVLHYQPIVDLVTGRVVAVEALARWQHPTRGLLAPAVWLDLAERCGLMAELGAALLRDACRQWPRLAAVHGPDVSVHVNVSATQLRDGRIAETVHAALADSGVPPSRVVLELTETQLLTIHDALVAELDEIRALGVRLAADDFGTGYSSLTQLTSLPIDEVKIDRRFVAAMATEPRSCAIVQGVLAMAHAMGLTVVAEGVETEETADRLRAAGCAVGQGFLWGRPGDIVDVRTVDEAP